jgi:hypothetical protein
MLQSKIVRARTIVTLAGLAASASVASAQVPTEWTIEMQARTGVNVTTPFNLPAPASLSSSQTVAIDADGAIVFHVGNIDNNVDSNGIFYGVDGVGGLIVGPITSADYSSTVDVKDGRIALAFGGFSGTGGEIRDTTGALLQAFPAGGPLGVARFEGLQINTGGALGYRTDAAAGTSWVIDEFDGGTRQQTAVAVEGGEYSFLFTPDLNDNREMAGKVMFASGGNGILRITDAGVATTIAVDNEADPGSVYDRFFNSTVLSDSGQVCFYGERLADSAFALVCSDGVTSTTIAAEGDTVGEFDEITSFPSFDPAINDRGWVAFRAAQTFGQSIFVGDGATTVRLVGLNDTVDTPQGQFFIDSFVSAVDINDAGQVSFIATLGDGSRAAFVATPVVACPADLTGDSVVDVFDLLAYLDDWFAGDADRNGDNVTDVFDLLDYLDIWFVGC